MQVTQVRTLDDVIRDLERVDADKTSVYYIRNGLCGWIGRDPVSRAKYRELRDEFGRIDEDLCRLKEKLEQEASDIRQGLR